MHKIGLEFHVLISVLNALCAACIKYVNNIQEKSYLTKNKIKYKVTEMYIVCEIYFIYLDSG